MRKIKRYRFVDLNGIQKGLEDTDSLYEAVQNAVDSECEVIDTQSPNGNQIVYSAWDGWNLDYDFYNKDIADFIMLEIRVKEKEQIGKNDTNLDYWFNGKITTEMIESLWTAACSGDIETLKQYYGVGSNLRNIRYIKFGEEISIIMGAYKNNQWKTINYLISVGETLTDEEKKDMQTELNRIDYMRILASK